MTEAAQDPQDRKKPPVACCLIFALLGTTVLASLGYLASETLGIAVIQRTMTAPSVLAMPDERTLAWTDPMGQICVSGQWGYFSQARSGAAALDAFSQDGTRLVGVIGRLIEASALAPAMYRIDNEPAFRAHGGGVTALAISNDGTVILQGSPSGVAVWRGSPRRLDGVFDGARSPAYVAISSTRVAVALTSKELVAFDPGTLERLWRTSPAPGVERVIPLPDGRVIACGHSVSLIDADGAPKGELARGPSVVAASRDGRLLALCGLDWIEVRAVDSPVSLHRSRLPGNRTIVSAVFSPDGRHLYVGTATGELIRTTYRGR